MTYNEFIEEIKGLDTGGELKLLDWQGNSYWMDRDKYDTWWLYKETYTGGVSGGSCWDDGGHYTEVSSSPIEPLQELDIILEHFVPTLSFLEYRILNNKLLQTDSKSVGEYYGNSSNYAIQKIKVEQLYNYMKEKSWI